MKPLYSLACVLSALLISMPQSALAKCVGKAVVVNGANTGSVVAVVPDSGSADLAAAGYQGASCAGVDKAAYLERVCRPSLIGNHGVQRQLEMQAGVSFAQLCAAARAEAGTSTKAIADTAASELPIPNRRSPVVRGGSGMVGPLGQIGAGGNSAGGN